MIGGLLALIYQFRFVADGPSLARSFFKTASVVVLAVGVFGAMPSLYEITELTGNVRTNPLALVILGLLFCAIGDFFLSRDGLEMLFFGVLAFTLGQFFYVAMMIYGVQETTYPAHWFRFTIMAMAVGFYFLMPSEFSLRLRFAIMGYMVVLLTVAWFAVHSSSPLLIVGALLFVLSDLMIALGFDDRVPETYRKPLQHAVWATYWPAQALLVWGFYLAI